MADEPVMMTFVYNHENPVRMEAIAPPRRRDPTQYAIVQDEAWRQFGSDPRFIPSVAPVTAGYGPSVVTMRPQWLPEMNVMAMPPKKDATKDGYKKGLRLQSRLDSHLF